MLIELVVATVMVLLTVAIHGLGIALLGQFLRSEARTEHLANVPPLSPKAFAVTMGLVLGLFALHGIEVWLYALLYSGIGAVADLRTAVYFSAVTYGTIGDSSVQFAPRWDLVAAIEGLNGIILLGWSTAFFVTIVSRIGRPRG